MDASVEASTDEFIIYAMGICSASVCSSLPMADVQARMRSLETGVESRWEWAELENFRLGEPNPCPCNKKPDTHRHYLFHC